jgi:hypothetical protein
MQQRSQGLRKLHCGTSLVQEASGPNEHSEWVLRNERMVVKVESSWTVGQKQALVYLNSTRFQTYRPIPYRTSRTLPRFALWAFQLSFG